MSIFSGLSIPSDKPQNSLGGSRYNFFYGSTPRETRQRTDRHANDSGYSCVRILSERRRPAAPC